MFRAKRADNGEWVEGYYIYRRPGNSGYIVSDNGVGFFVERVVPETVCQYTGLNDKNGNKIFDGDLLDSDLYPFYSDGKHNYFAEIFLLDEQLTTCIEAIRYPNSNVRGISDGLIDYVENFHSENWEIIGNIFDNPELLGGDE